MWWIWSIGWALAAPCEEAASLADLEADLEAAERRLGDLDSDAFLDQTADLAPRVACLAEPLEPVRVAHLHRVFGLRAYLARQDADARAAFGAARAADPNYVFPFWLVPERHEIRELYAASEPELTRFPVLPAKNGLLLFDGEETNERPRFRPTLAQVLDDAGAVEATAWLRPTDVMPAYDEARPLLPPLAGGARTVRTTLFASSGAAVVLSGVSYGLAGLANQRFQSAEDRQTVLDSQRQSRIFVTTSAVSGGAAVAALTGAFLVGRI